MIETRGSAPARAALAGNPSDGYGGAVLAVAIDDFQAEARVAVDTELRVIPDSSLVEATARRFARNFDPGALATRVEWATSIPRAVGLGGSSAIVIATLRALCELRAVQLPEPELAELALAIETEELGIEAGLQDRVAQAYGGLTFMEFGEHPRYERLDREVLPPLLIAWREDAGQDSDHVHGDLRARFDRGEPVVVDALSRLGELARAARDALLAGDVDAFAASVDGSFDVRRELLELDPRHTQLVKLARARDASVNYTGSGGAIVAVCRDERHRSEVNEALVAAGCGTARAGAAASSRAASRRTAGGAG